MKRGDVVVVATGKPRPAIVVQDDRLTTPIDILLCPVTSTLLAAPLYRLPVAANPENGLERNSQIMVDKVGSARRDQVDRIIGRLSDEEMAELSDMMAIVLGIGSKA